ncbi:hypothetical protein SAMN05421505_14018 [Sinosporangium album]|uniref:Uncharacterized protein n=1 Tax=Sinosporangium album TaxID=504805 RepID=A0A1G8IZB8_9ACTN|nr:hypothetical protein SAMN05421505_14018 [Sinosporangium album]
MGQRAGYGGGLTSTEYVERFGQALDDGLDTPRAVQTLDELFQNNDLPDGRRFETAVLLDRVLGLELARDVGRY